jgi:hypothetical protein
MKMSILYISQQHTKEEVSMAASNGHRVDSMFPATDYVFTFEETNMRDGAREEYTPGTPAQQRIYRAQGLAYHARRLQRQAAKIRKIERERDRLARQVNRHDERIAAASADYARMVEALRYFSAQEFDTL